MLRRWEASSQVAMRVLCHPQKMAGIFWAPRVLTWLLSWMLLPLLSREIFMIESAWVKKTEDTYFMTTSPYDDYDCIYWVRKVGGCQSGRRQGRYNFIVEWAVL